MRAQAGSPHESALREQQEADIHEVLEGWGSAERSPPSLEARHRTAVFVGFVFVALVSIAIAAGLQLGGPPGAFVVLGLSALFLLSWGVWISIMARNHRLNRRRAKEIARERHPEHFPARDHA